MKWEYQLVAITSQGSETTARNLWNASTMLTELGAQGWEAVGFCELYLGNKVVLLKRPSD